MDDPGIGRRSWNIGEAQVTLKHGPFTVRREYAADSVVRRRSVGDTHECPDAATVIPHADAPMTHAV
jgi:hypothetical protein